jgi:hypothetical protein
MAKAHSKWAASASARNLICAGNIALLEGLPHIPSGYPAKWGTVCHGIVERCLNNGSEASAYIGEVIDEEGTVFVIDEEFVECATVYTDYVRARMAEGFILQGVEIMFDLGKLGARMEAGGTADTVLYHPELQELEVPDLKTGKGVLVEVLGNAQARFYAVGTVIAFPLLKVKTFRSTIVQPRVPHRHGRIRSEVLDVVDMHDWAVGLVEGINKSQDALDAFHAASGNSVLLDQWADIHLVAGEQCTFCPAAGGCPKLRKLAMEASGADFEGGAPRFKSNRLADNAPAVVERDLDLIPLLEEWIKGRRALAHTMAENGTQFDHYEMMEKIGNRKFAGATTGEIVKAIRARIHITNEQLFDEPKLKSPAGLERAIGKKVVADNLADLIIRPVTGTDLVHTGASNTPSRKRAQTVSERFYEN